ncbi:hypothetical protein L8Q94_03610 [Enterobacter kobei]|uniref:hypothetical protein n=1 Tax=Enterobacter kobei TaxID=208224 RepID=UPI0020057B68|nr:hypothetical protein [Enterobacter kobei]MCK6822471.1 hypothetical protein [Enterobacter kobei]
MSTITKEWLQQAINDYESVRDELPYQQNQYTTAAKQMLGVMAESAWKAGRRAAMLQGAERVTTARKLSKLTDSQ